MWIKVVIVFLFVALLASLVSGYVFLMKDRGATKRTWHSLSVRLILAALLMGFLIFGVSTGRLGSNAPWDARHFAPAQSTPVKPEAVRPESVEPEPVKQGSHPANPPQ